MTLLMLPPFLNQRHSSDIHVSKWSRNQFTQGSFSDAMIGTDDGTFENIAGRLDRLFFAGEGSISAWFSYVEGAYYTGKKQAEAIASCINGKLCEPFVPYTWPDQNCESSGALQPKISLVSLVGMAVGLFAFSLC